MNNDLPAPPAAGSLTTAVARARAYAQNAKAENTLRAYQSDWRQFTAWCQAQGLQSLPASPETVAAHLGDLGGQRKASTLKRRLTAISRAHDAAGAENPTRHILVASVMEGIQRTHGSAQEGKAPLETDELRRLVATLPTDSLNGLRDRALLVIGFAGGFRRSELVALQVADIEFRFEGVAITIRRSKTDQKGEGRVIGLPYGSHVETCPVRTLQAWLEASGIQEGALFRPLSRSGKILSAEPLSAQSVALVIKRAAEKAGLDPDRYAGHSLRAGFVTSAAGAGVDVFSIMDQTGHKSMATVKRYVRKGTIWRNNPAAALGL